MAICTVTIYTLITMERLKLVNRSSESNRCTIPLMPQKEISGRAWYRHARERMFRATWRPFTILHLVYLTSGAARTRRVCPGKWLKPSVECRPTRTSAAFSQWVQMLDHESWFCGANGGIAPFPQNKSGLVVFVVSWWNTFISASNKGHCSESVDIGDAPGSGYRVGPETQLVKLSRPLRVGSWCHHLHCAFRTPHRCHNIHEDHQPNAKKVWMDVVSRIVYRHLHVC